MDDIFVAIAFVAIAIIMIGGVWVLCESYIRMTDETRLKWAFRQSRFWAWWKLKLILDSSIPKLGPNEQAERMEKNVQRLVLRLYKNGYDPAVIARVLSAHAIAFVCQCSGPERDHAQLFEAGVALEKMLITEYWSRRLSAPYDRVAQFIRPNEI